MTRIESGSTAGGVADVDYACPRAHGWVELKTSHVPNENSPYALGSEFTAAQAAWLLNHHRPSIHLLSYLLIGTYTAQGRWDHFVILTPRAACSLFLSGRARLRRREVEGRADVVTLYRAGDVTRWILGGGGHSD